MQEKDPGLKGKKVAIVALGSSQIDFVIGLENSKQWDEVWCINSALAVYRQCDRVFMLDPPSRYLDTEDAGNQTEIMRKLLPVHPGPIYTCELDERVPGAVEFPLAEVVTYGKCAYLNNTVAYAVAYAYWQEVAHIDLFGVDFSYSHNLHFAEAGRACVEFWISKCLENKIGIGASPRSSLLDSNVGVTERLYGYHRLEDPIVAMPHQDEWVLCPRSQLSKVIQEREIELVKVAKAPEPYKG